MNWQNVSWDRWHWNRWCIGLSCQLSNIQYISKRRDDWNLDAGADKVIVREVDFGNILGTDWDWDLCGVVYNINQETETGKTSTGSPDCGTGKVFSRVTELDIDEALGCWAWLGIWVTERAEKPGSEVGIGCERLILSFACTSASWRVANWKWGQTREMQQTNKRWKTEEKKSESTRKAKG